MKNILKNQYIRISLVVILTAGITMAVIFFINRNNSNAQLNSVLTSVGKLIVLPTSEKPALAVVTDQSKLQSGLKGIAQTGDDVLVYQKSGMVIVYRPSINKLVAVQPILVGSQPNASLNVTVAILNGSGDSGKQERFITSLYEKYPNLRLISKADAPRLFPKTIVYGAATGDSLAAEVAQDLAIQAGQTPEGIAKSDATLTFIIGQDAQ